MSKKPAPQTQILDRSEAVGVIAGHLADRDAFVISVPPAVLVSAASRLSEIASCRWYADNGTDIVLVLTGKSIQVSAAVDMLLPGMTAAVAIIPKTVPATRLADALGNIAEIPEDGSKDLIMLQSEDETVAWPRLLADALAKVDSKFALALAANDLTSMS